MATTSRPNISSKFENNDIPTEEHFGQIIESFVHKDDKADFQMVQIGTDNEHYITPALLNVGLKNIGIITGNSYMPKKEYFDISLTGATTVSLEEFPIPNSVRVYKNGQLLQEGEGENLDYDYTVNYNTAIITFSGVVSDRNIEVDYWFKNLSPSPGTGGGETGEPIDFSGFLHTTGNETKSGILTFNNTTPSSKSGIVLTNSGNGVASKALDITLSGSGSGISLQNSSTGKGVYLNSTTEATGDILQVAKNNVVKVKIENDGVITAPKFVTDGGTEFKFVKGDGSLDPTVYAEDSKALHTTGEESKDGALNLTNSLQQDVLTIEKSNDANCLKLVQNSNDADTTSTWDTGTDIAERKAISIKKLGDQTAFITHDGDVAARSFSTAKANLTDDGLFSLENRPSPESSEGKAKLYAKNDGIDTHMYVMGSDGVEKKIGGDVDLSEYAKLDSPDFTGVPTAPTAAAGTNTTQIATTAFVQSKLNSITTNFVIPKYSASANGFVNSSLIDGGAGSRVQCSIPFFLTGNSAQYGFLGTGDGGGGAGGAWIGKYANANGDLYVKGTNNQYGAVLSNASLTATRVYTFPDKAGIVALTSDIPSQGALAEPSQITITTAASITTDTLDTNSKNQIGKNVVINNGSSAINITVNGGTDFCASYLKIGTGAITFVQGSGRTLVLVDGTAVFNGIAGSTATISSVGTTDYLRISNA